MIGIAYFFGALSGILIGFIACAALMFPNRAASPELHEHVDAEGN